MKRRVLGIAASIDRVVYNTCVRTDRWLLRRSGISVRRLPRDIYLWCMVSMLTPIAVIVMAGLLADEQQLENAIHDIDRALPQYAHLIIALVVATHMRLFLKPVLRWVHERLDWKSATNPNKDLGSGYAAWASLLNLIGVLGVGLAWVYTLADGGLTIALGLFVWFWLSLLTSILLESWRSFLNRTNTPRRKKRWALRFSEESLLDRLAELRT